MNVGTHDSDDVLQYKQSAIFEGGLSEVTNETYTARQRHAMVYRRFGTRNCSYLSLVVGISDGFVGSKYRHSDHDSPSTHYAWSVVYGEVGTQ
jgi:hypothetical protein